MKTIFSLLLMLSIFGCANTTKDLGGEVKSVTEAGVSSIEIEPVAAEAGTEKLGTQYDITLGKEYENFTFTTEFECALNPAGERVPPCTPKKVTAQASQVKAFEGQQTASEAVKEIRKYLTEQNISVTESAASAMTDIVKKAISGP